MLEGFVMVLDSFWTLVSSEHVQNHNYYRTKGLNQAPAITKLILKIKKFLLHQKMVKRVGSEMIMPGNKSSENMQNYTLKKLAAKL